MPTSRGPRERRRSEVSARLLDVARDELARTGAAGLSVRAVARGMGMAPSALFRYISGRDELLTLLIVDAYSRLADHVEAAESAVPRHDLRGRWRAMACSFREWAAAHPHDYALLYGSPVPDYHAPADRTNAAGTRVTDLLVAIGMEAPDPVRRAPVPGMPSQDRLRELAQAAGVPHLAGERLVSGLLAWTLLVGAVSSELFEQLGESIARLDALFDGSVALGEWLLFGAGDEPDSASG
ncbi:MAG TPA: TetR/AcrR family transcriptional regulator [Propionibacteriaceae bacterium]|nr:TetR/AcrR family transcriptional regulator [Propionibacteriaceae bacterium]